MFHSRLSILLGLLVLAPQVVAATFTANSSIDAPDNNPGDGLCRSDLLPISACTLRAAIMEANALPGSHIINLQAGRTYTLSRSGIDNSAVNGDLDITKSLIVWCLDCGQRPVLDVNGLDRGFDIHAGEVLLSGFDITGGVASSGAENRGGAVRVRAGAGTTTLSQMRLYDNQSTGPGGAFYNEGPDTVISTSELFDNEVTDNASGTAILNFNVLTVRRSAVFGNAGNAPLRAAIATAAFDGMPGRLTLENTTVSSNIGVGVAVNNSGFTRIFNSTIAGNTLRGLEVVGATPAVTTNNSLIARNGNPQCAVSAPNGAFAGEYNLFSDSSCAVFANASLQGVAPLLTPLKRRSGGTTVTHLHWPRSDSPALSAGSVMQVGGCLDVDQLGISRPQGHNGTVRCDIGAAEVPDDALFFDSLETL